MTTHGRRVVVWSTGGVGSNAIRAIARRPDLDLVGVWVHTPEKVGRDAGELAGVDPLGVLATDDIDSLIGLAPDCVVYAASGPERGAGAVPEYERLLGAGINVVTTTSTDLVHPPVGRRNAPGTARARGATGRRLALCVRNLPGIRVRRARSAAHHTVTQYPNYSADRSLAQRPLPRGGCDDGRTRFRLATWRSSPSSPSLASFP